MPSENSRRSDGKIKSQSSILHFLQQQPNRSSARPPTALGRPPSSLARPQVSPGRPPYSLARPPSSLNRPRSSRGRPQSSSDRPKASPGRPQASLVRLPSALAGPQSSLNKPLSPGRDLVSKHQSGTWQPLAIGPSSSNKSKAPPSLSPMHNGNVNTNAPQQYYPGISVPSLPPLVISLQHSHPPPARLWVPLGSSKTSNTNAPPRRAGPSMWLPNSSPSYGNGVRTTYPGMSLATTTTASNSRQGPQDSSAAYLTGPWYTLAALGPKSFIVTPDRERILTYIAAGSPVPIQHLWAIIAELHLCKKNYADGLDTADGTWCRGSMEPTFDLSPYLKMAYDVDVHEGVLDAMFERLERFTDRGSSMWGLQVGAKDRVVWDAMAEEAEAAFDRLAPETKQHVRREWKRYAWDARRRVVKRSGAK